MGKLNAFEAGKEAGKEAEVGAEPCTSGDCDDCFHDCHSGSAPKCEYNCYSGNSDSCTHDCHSGKAEKCTCNCFAGILAVIAPKPTCETRRLHIEHTVTVEESPAAVAGTHTHDANTRKSSHSGNTQLIVGAG